ncbi:hypothetical protein JCM10450v2_007775 [Rhodotorula kratochvilovae]
MQPTLPLELQLQILELAIPPLTRKNLPHLRELMKTWPLVSRAWKAWAYAKIPVVPKLVLRDAETDQAMLDRSLAAVAASGRAVKRFEVDIGEWMAADVTDHELRDFNKDIEELWITLPLHDSEWLLLPGLRHLHIDDYERDAAENLLGVSPPHLEYLALGDVDVPLLETTFATITTLVLGDYYFEDTVPSLLSCFPSLRIFALHDKATFGNEDILLAHTSSYPATLHHLLLSDCEWQVSSRAPSVPLHFPATLKTLTLRYSYSALPQCRTTADLVRAACIGTETTFTEVYFNRADPLETDFDVEAWALSVGA